VAEWSDVVPKILPIEKLYDDAIAPAAKQVGRLGGDTAKVVRLILAPIQGLALLQDRLDQMCERIAKKVPEDRRIEVSPEISGPALDAMTYLDDKSELWQLLEEILTKSMDAQQVHLAHPAFIVIAKQLTPDEIRILYRLREGAVYVSDGMDLDVAEQKFVNRIIHSNGFDIDLIVPSQFELYVFHLQSLGLVAWTIGKQTPIIDHNGVQTGIKRDSSIALTDFGRMFVEAGRQQTIDGTGAETKPGM